jgi:DNA-binding Lrp family transcriptional regulator
METPPIQETAPVKNTGQPVQKTPAVPRTGGVQGKGAIVIPIESPHLRTPHEITDQILPTLEPASQVILMRLYRLSAGFNSATCQVSIPKLVNTCHVSESKVRNCLRDLESKGLIRRLSVDLSNKSQLDRGLTFEVLLPRLATSRGTGGVLSTGGFSQTAPFGGTPNKEKDLKEKNLKEMASCLDCKGTGFWYPGGFDAGVAKCTHEGSSTRKK